MDMVHGMKPVARSAPPSDRKRKKVDRHTCSILKRLKKGTLLM